MPSGDDALRSFTRMSRSGPIALLFNVLAASVPIGGVMAQFNTPDIPICDPCAFPLVADVDMNGSPDLIFTSPELESITWRANDSVRPCATMRPAMSVDPPTANGISMRIGRSG